MDKIVDNLYLGDIRAAANLFLLKQHVSHSPPQTTNQSFLLTLSILGCNPHLASPGWTQPMFPICEYPV